MIFNGEIYNFKELRAELEQRGHQFRTRSDTEVIVHGYKEWGTDVFNHLNGMFGVAIWDVKKRAADRGAGCHGHQARLLPHCQWPIDLRIGNPRHSGGGKLKASVDPVALNLFLRFRYTPSPLTIFKGIRKLAPGTMLVVEAGKYREERWYNYTPMPFRISQEDEEELAQELLELYRGAVKRHLLSDVPGRNSSQWRPRLGLAPGADE